MKRIAQTLLWTILLLAKLGVASAAESYSVDTVHSFIGFSVKHMAVASVRGEFRAYTVELMVDEEDLTQSSILLKIDATSIDTRNQRRDDHLRSADFLEVETYPELVFRSKKIEEDGSGRYKATGDLTIRDTTREVVLELEINGPIQDPWGNFRVGAEGGVTIDRQDYGVNFSSVMDNGGLVVSDEVKISFALEASRKAE